MKSQAEYLQPRSSGRVAVQSRLMRTLIALLFLGASVLVTQMLLRLLSFILPAETPIYYLISIAVSLALTYFAYGLYVESIERRRTSELDLADAGIELGGGVLIGSGLFTLIIGLLWVVGNFRFDGVNSWLMIFPAMAANIPAAFLQEIIFRGVIFRITEEALGTLWALFISVPLFALIQLFTTQTNSINTIFSMVSAGILLSAAYLLTRRLWLAIGLHVSWDLTSNGIFGVDTLGSSGIPLQGLLRGSLANPTLFSSGAGRLEGTLIAAAVMLAACVILIIITMERGRWRKRSRRRSGTGG